MAFEKFGEKVVEHVNEHFNETRCAWCRSDVPSAASVCAHCGAIKGYVMDTWETGLGCKIALFLVLLVLIAIVPKTLAPILIPIVTVIVVLIGLFFGLKRTWLRRN